MPSPRDDYNYLAWFLGPKSENAPYFEELLSLIVRDYVHWRRNYFPSDKILISKRLQRHLEDDYDTLSQRLFEHIALLRRNFPFYSPRYMGHQLSDVSMPSVLGYIAGMLYNPNNVTTESSPVTIDWELDACNRILEMIGFSPPPAPEDVARARRDVYGWAHITSGGTIANIEALWVARNVRYFPLAARDAAIAAALPVEIHDTRGEAHDIRDLDEWNVLQVKPGEAIALLTRFAEACQHQYDLPRDEAVQRMWELIRKSPYSLHNGVGASFAQCQPVLFVSGAGHYSVDKAMDILGIGAQHIEYVHTDKCFRMDVDDLRRRIRRALAEHKLPLAVVGIVGTTEEGAIDPLHEIADLREELHAEGSSFWLHIDAAWGGFIRTLFRPEPDVELRAIQRKVGERLDLPTVADDAEWESALGAYLSERAESDEARGVIDDAVLALSATAHAGRDTAAYTRQLRHLLVTVARALPDGADNDLRLNLADRLALVNEYVQSRADITWEGENGSSNHRGLRFHRDASLQWGSREVGSALLAMDRADSATIDPHKLAYCPYPLGVVAFRNDRIRHFIMQKAPYITSAGQDPIAHQPPRHPTDSGVGVDAFAPFILEGSRPGAAASALYLATDTMPLTMHRHGAVIRASLLAAREMYEWFALWPRIRESDPGIRFDVIPVTAGPPDTNIVTFCVREVGPCTLDAMNRLTKNVYERFTIQAELGEKEFSYTQPFFLTTTVLSEPKYEYDTLADFLENRADLWRPRDDFRTHGLRILRASVMNPYIEPMNALGVQNFIAEFVAELVQAARGCLKTAAV